MIDAVQKRKNIISTLVNYRNKEGFTQYRVCKQQGITQSSVARFEDGENATLDTFIKYLNAFDIDLEKIIETEIHK